MRAKSTRGMAWSAVERFSLLGIQFIIQIVLARLLTPDDYGVIGMLAVFLAVSQTFIDSGFGKALIQNQRRTERDFATMFVFNIAVACVFYAILFASAPWIADFYEMPILVPVTRVLALSMIVSAFAAVHRAKLEINVDFKTQAKATIAASLFSGIVGIAMAYCGFGVWALVAQTLVSAGTQVVLFWLLIKWFPRYFFSWKSFKPMFRFGSKLVVASLLHTIYSNLYSIFIGKIYSASALGFYTKANMFAGLPSQVGNGILGRVTFPVLAQVQGDNARLKHIYGKYLRFSTSLLVPLMLGICAVAKPLVIVLIGEKWLPCVPFLQVLCFAWMCDPIMLVNLNLIYVKGRTDLVLKLEIVKKITATLMMFCGLPFGVLGLCVARAVYAQIAVFMNTYYTGKFLEMTYWVQIREVAPIYLSSGTMCAIAWGTTLLFENAWISLFAGTLVGTVFYLGVSYILKFEFWEEAKIFLNKIRSRYGAGE